MSTVFVKKIDESHIKFDSDDRGVLMEMNDYFSFFAPGYKFSPQYQRHFWDGKTRLCNMHTHTALLGLRSRIKDFCLKRGYEYIDQSDAETKEDFSGLDDFVKTLNLPFEPRDYQMDGVRYALHDNKCVLLSPTGSGKSLLQYILVRWHHSKGRKVCLIVPTVSLVEQMIKDFGEYAVNDPTFDVDKTCIPMYGRKKNDPFEADILISTWQSLKNYDKSLFKMWDTVMVDECFDGDCNVLTKDGYKPIKEIKSGDVIINYDKITKAFKEDVVESVYKNMILSQNEKMLELSLDNGKNIKVTANHKFLTINGWKKAEDLNTEDEIISFEK